jgi:SOS-response transcriptional repressor LexA
MQKIKPELTDRQTKTLQFIIDFIEQNQIPPSYREIAKGLDVSSLQGISDMLKRLTKKGYIEMAEPCQARSIKILKHPP